MKKQKKIVVFTITKFLIKNCKICPKKKKSSQEHLGTAPPPTNLHPKKAMKWVKDGSWQTSKCTK